jgi:membrane protein DedA with SNARE-associated domain
MSFSLIESIVDVITLIMATLGLPGLFVLMADESFGIPPIPSEVILPFAGFLVADGTYSFGAALSVSLAGGLVGAFIAYAIGRWWRSRLVGLGVGRLRLRENDLARVDTWFTMHGEVTVALARFVPFFRSYISYPAGTARMSPTRFGLYTLLGTIPWNIGLIYAGFVLRSHWTEIVTYVEPFDYLFAALIGVGVLYLVLIAAGVLDQGWPPRRVRRDVPATGRAPGGTDPPPAGPAP